MSYKRRPFIAGNWKMNKTVQESVSLARALKAGLVAGVNCEVCVAPPATALFSVKETLAGSPVRVSSQNVHPKDNGAFTGELSPLQVKEVASHAIVGHSERRHVFGEKDEFIAEKVQALLSHRLTPILCIGETLEERQSKRTLDVVLGQLEKGLMHVAKDATNAVIVAYEPVWAIGTGKTASPSDAQAVHGAIRDKLTDLAGARLAQEVRILYGGSVKPANAAELLSQADIDGALVGGASLSADSFLSIIDAAK